MIPLLEFERGPAGPQRPALPNIGIFEAQLEAMGQGAALAPTRKLGVSSEAVEPEAPSRAPHE